MSGCEGDQSQACGSKSDIAGMGNGYRFDKDSWSMDEELIQVLMGIRGVGQNPMSSIKVQNRVWLCLYRVVTELT